MGSLIRANTANAKFRPIGISHILQDRAGAAIYIQEGVGFGEILTGGGVKINCSRSKGCHFCQVVWEFTDEMLTHPSTPALLFSVHLRKNMSKIIRYSCLIKQET